MDFEKPSSFADVVFIVENKQIFANKAILSMSSPVFCDMFSASWEKYTKAIPLRKMTFDTFIVFMQALHPPFWKTDDDNVEWMLDLAYQYQVQYVIDHCESVLLEREPSVKSLKLADMYQLPNLRLLCLTHLSHTVPLAKVVTGKDYDDLNSNTLKELMRKSVTYKQEPSMEFLCDLMSKPPSVESLVLAEKYDLAQLQETCIQYAKETPLSALSKEPGYKDIKDATLIEILTHKVQEWESAGAQSSNDNKNYVFGRQIFSKEKN